MLLPLQQFVTENRRAIDQLCVQQSVKELYAFGSVVTDQFDSLNSDVDIVADFYNPEASGIADRYMALASGLESIFQRPVDLVTKPAMKNPIFRRTVEKTSHSIYAG